MASPLANGLDGMNWRNYENCPTCRRVTGERCRDLTRTKLALLDQPHPGRPLRTLPVWADKDRHTPTLAQMVSTYLERARVLEGAAASLQKAGDAADAEGCRGEAAAYELVARELTAAFLFPAPGKTT